jgi:hypothetical protein
LIGDEKTVIFCIDISGSMNSGVETKNGYASKLDCIKNVLSEKIKSMAIDHPRRKVGIILFE